MKPSSGVLPNPLNLENVVLATFRTPENVVSRIAITPDSVI